MITVTQLAQETALKPRTIQKRIARLGIKVQRAGATIVISPSQAERIKTMSAKSGPKVRA